MQNSLIVYQSVLSEKYKAVFSRMREVIQEKQLDYMTFLLKQLNHNRDRVQMEKVTLDKMMGSFYEAADKFKPELEK